MPLDKREIPKHESDARYARLGAFLRKKREEYGLLQEEVANYCLISRTQIVNIERGRTAPSMDLVFRLAEAFEYSDRIGDFLADAGYTNQGV